MRENQDFNLPKVRKVTMMKYRGTRRNSNSTILYSRTRDRHCTSIINKNYPRIAAYRSNAEHSPIISTSSSESFPPLYRNYTMYPLLLVPPKPVLPFHNRSKWSTSKYSTNKSNNVTTFDIAKKIVPRFALEKRMKASDVPVGTVEWIFGRKD